MAQPGRWDSSATQVTGAERLFQGRNRLHLDLEPDDRDAEVERLVNMGARHVDLGQDEVGPDELGGMVLADPEGNEFRVLMPSHESRTP